MNWLSEFEKQQTELLKVITNFSTSPGRVPEEATLPHLLLHQNERTNLAALGQASYKKFVAFANSIDHSHPDLLNIFDGELIHNKPNTFLYQFSCLTRLASQCENWGYNREFTYGLKGVLHKHKLWKQISRTLDDPKMNQQLVRLVPSSIVRAHARACKKAQEINLDLLIKRGTKFWTGLPTTFSSFHRFQSRTSKEVLAAKKKHEHFKNFGLQEMANFIGQSIAKLEFGYNKQMYYGFNRVTNTQVVGILAKMLGSQLENDKITLTNKDFNIDGKEPTPLKFRARSYPMHVVNGNIACAKVNNVIKHVESFPEFNSKPAFDNYYLVIGTAEYPSPPPNGGIYYFTDHETKKQLAFGSITDYYQHFDFKLLKQQKIPAVVLGERDGTSYFLCYWV